MPDISYDAIKPLITSAEQQGASMRVTFTCPVTGAVIQAQGHLEKGKGIGSVVASSAKRSLMYSVRRGVARAIRGVLGYGIFGRVGSEVAREMINKGTSASAGASFSDDEKEAGVVRAFEAVQSQFTWDTKRGQWVSAQAVADQMTDFTKQLSAAPVQGKYDCGVLARMLVEVANADNQLAAEERAFMEEFISSDLGSIADLANRPALSGAELGETTAGASRDTMLMLASALAFCDEAFDQREAKRLEEHAAGLGIAGERAAELQMYARAYMLDQALEQAYSGGQRNEAALQAAMTMAKQIGLSAEDAERVDIRFRKRNGLI